MSEQAQEFAVIRSGGKQYTVTPGSRVRVERLEAEIGATIELNEVLMGRSGQGSEIQVGAPLLQNALVRAKVIAQPKAKKVTIFKKRRRKGYTKKQGHRQLHTDLVIESISL